MDFIKAAGDMLFGSKPAEPEAPKLDEGKIVAFVRSRLEEGRGSSERLAFESSVVTNTAYLLGYDSLYYDSRQRMFRNYAGGSASPNRGRVHKNMILPSIQNRLARLCKNAPKFDVRPESPSEEDKEAARLGLKTLVNIMDRERYNERRIECTMWMQQAGYSWIKVGWDPDKGKKIYYDDPETGAQKQESEGDVYIDVVSPLEVFVDPLAKNMSDARWLLHTRLRPLAYFRDNYERGAEVKAEDAYLSNIQNLLKINTMTNKSGTTNGQLAQKNSAIECALYERPSKKFPNGRLIITANNILLAYKPLPIDEIPFVKFDDVKVGGKFHSESLITHMRPLQDQMNRILRRKKEYLDKALNMKFLAAKGHGLNEEALSDTTEVAEYNPVPNSEMPKSLVMPQLPQYAFQEDQSLMASFSEIVGIGEPSKGQAPSSDIPAIGMQLLVEQDDTRIGIVVESNENSHADVGRITLKFTHKCYTTPRTIKETGQGGEYSFTEVSGDKLNPSPDVIVMKGSTLPGSKAVKRNDIMNLLNQGLLGDPQDPAVRAKALEWMEFGDVQNVWEDQAIDAAQVARSIKQIEQGQTPIISPDDNHQMHFDKKNSLRKTVKFEMYPPQVQMIFLNDMQQHKMFLMPPAPMPPMGPGGPPPPEAGAPPPMEGAQ